MKFKLDENLGREAARVQIEAGFDVVTVPDQNLTSAPDRVVIDRCVGEERCLVTMDLEFDRAPGPLHSTAPGSRRGIAGRRGFSSTLERR